MASSSDLKRVMKALDKQIYAAVQAGISSTYFSAKEIADAGRDEAKRLVNHPGSYKPYIDEKGNRRMSSRPGEPPASGPEYNLYNTIVSVSISKKNQNPARAAFGTNADYAQNLEFGTSWYSPRPFMRPAIAHARSVATAIVVRNWNRAVARKVKSMPNPPMIEIQG